MEYFIKDGTRYKSVGFEVPNYLPEGLWLISRKPGSTSYEGMTHRLSALPDSIDVEMYLKLFLNTNQLVKALIDLELVKSGNSYQETAELITNQIITNNLKEFQCKKK